MKKIFLFLFYFLFYICPFYSQSGWFLLNSGVVYELNSVIFTNSSTGYVAGWGGIVKTTNSGINWTSQVNGYDFAFDVLFFTNQNIGYAGCDIQYLFKTTNGGINWIMQSSNMGRVWTIFFIDDNLGYTGGKYGEVRKTTNGGISWIDLSNPGYGNFESFYFINSNTGFAATEYGTIYKTTNGAISWDTSYFSSNTCLFSIHFINSNTGFSTGFSLNLYKAIILKTTNAGESWSSQTPYDAYSSCKIRFYDLFNGMIMYSEGIILKTTNSGDNWMFNRINYDINSFYYTSLDTIYAAGKFGTIIKSTTGGFPIGIQPISNSIPSKFILFQNYPNPFNPITHIKFDLPEESFVQLTIYDILGRLVAIIVNEELQPNTYNFTWDGLNHASGVYFYQFQAGNFIQTKKLVLLK